MRLCFVSPNLGSVWSDGGAADQSVYRRPLAAAGSRLSRPGGDALRWEISQMLVVVEVAAGGGPREHFWK